MYEYIFSAAILVQLALLFQALGLLARDEMWLRVLILIGTIFYVLYYFFIADRPLWEAILSSSVLGVINVGMIVLLLVERTTFAMGTEMASAFQNFPTLTPGQFRKLMKIGKIVKPDARTTVCTMGQQNDRLFFLLNGTVSIDRGKGVNDVPAPMFVGEVAFLSGAPASATVRTGADVNLVEWRTDDLRRLMQKSKSMENALIALLSADLAAKVSQSAPMARTV